MPEDTKDPEGSSPSGATPPKLPPFVPNPNLTLAEADATIREYTNWGASARWRRGFIYRQVLANKLWAQDPQHRFKSGPDWGKKAWGDSERELRDKAAVCRTFEEPITWRYDFTNLVSFIGWANAAKLDPWPKDPGDTVLRVPVKKQLVEKKFRDCTNSEIKAAKGALKPKKDQQKLPAEMAERWARVQATLQEMLPKGTPNPLKIGMDGKKPWLAVSKTDWDTLGIVALAITRSRARVPVPSVSPAEALPVQPTGDHPSASAPITTPEQAKAFAERTVAEMDAAAARDPQMRADLERRAKAGLEELEKLKKP